MGNTINKNDKSSKTIQGKQAINNRKSVKYY